MPSWTMLISTPTETCLISTVVVISPGMSVVLSNVAIDADRAKQAASTGYLNATELADYLVKREVPFREAHEIVGKVVLFAISQKKELNELSLNELSKFSKKIGSDVFRALSLEQTLASKNAVGGTSPQRVREALKAAKRYLKDAK